MIDEEQMTLDEVGADCGHLHCACCVHQDAARQSRLSKFHVALPAALVT
jgi:hypothetical protein